jgi:ferrous iron transport protein B
METELPAREIVIALAGNPNSGKTTVFNELTGSHQHVGNWAGVTVEHKEGSTRRFDRDFSVVDLPGTYSLTACSQEEVVARDYLLDSHVDVIVNVVDATNLERNLYLTTQLLELGINMVIALNMVDMAESAGQSIDVGMFSHLLGVPVVPTVGHRGEGMNEILAQAIKLADSPTCGAPRTARHNPEIEIELESLESRIDLNSDCMVPVRWMLIKAMEDDREAITRLLCCARDPDSASSEIDATRKHLELHFGHDLEAIIADGRYGFIGGLVREIVTRTRPVEQNSLTDKIDNILLNRALGLPIFLLMMWLMFKLTFDVGGILSGYIHVGVYWLGNWAAAALPPGPLASLISHAIIDGVGGVIVFLPNILVMFVIISFLEGSGYMARAAFLMDRSMHVVGLHGKSFIPMLMGFGCNVPAVMAARTLETREDRILTILITPLMSCSARLPIYIMFTSAFFPKKGALVIFSLYAMGIILAVASGKLFRRTLFAKSVSPFVMELPPYRLPTLKGTLIHMWERTSSFVTKAGTVVLAASVIIWALGALPWGVEFGGPHSLIGQIGRYADPMAKTLGMDWRAAVALFCGLGAKEITVGALGVLYVGQGGGASVNTALKASFTPLTGYVFMVLSLIYIPCIATIAAVRRETNSWKWTLFSVGYSLVLAYVVAFVIYHAGLLVGLK